MLIDPTGKNNLFAWTHVSVYLTTMWQVNRAILTEMIAADLLLWCDVIKMTC